MDVNAAARAIELICSDPHPHGLDRQSEPVTLGLPFPVGMVPAGDTLGLYDREGHSLPVQTRVLSRWSDGSARWILVDFQATVSASESRLFRLQPAGSDVLSTVPSPIVISSAPERGVTVDTGAATFRLRVGGRMPFEEILVKGSTPLDCRRSGLAVEGASHACELSVSNVIIEESGALRSVIRLDGVVTEGTQTLAEIVVRIHFFAGSTTTRLLVTLRNPRRATHSGGLWELGDAGSIYLRRMTFSIPIAADRNVWWSVDPESPFERCAGDLRCYQESSGGEYWQSANHVNRHGAVPLTLRGFRVDLGGATRTGERATPCVVVADAGSSRAITMKDFWQNFPKSLAVERETMTLGLFPGEYPDHYELQGGEQKTFDFHVAWDRDQVTKHSLDWCRTPLFARASPEWYASSGAVPDLSPESDDPNEDYKALVRTAIDGPDTFFHKRELIDEYGWRNFGDLYADHEAVLHKGPRPLVSHYNNQYDAVGGFAVQFMRSGDPRWWRLMTDLAAHVVDIDVYHTSLDKSAYNHGPFWHTYHYVDAGMSTHRSYPRASGVSGGGPAVAQVYLTGLLLHFYLTGSAQSLETVLEVAQFVVDADDGSLTVFRWLDRGYTGVVSDAGPPHYAGPVRAAANSINGLLDGYRAGGESRFLQKAEQIIRRCIHPHDDIDARDLLDAEYRWFYTLFLQALGRYLNVKADAGQLDVMYAYARASLLAYARWMAVHEYPYLETPEKLEYPTETWAAQDIRKSDVFNYAARHASREEAERFLERSAFFFRYSTSTLRAMPTGTLTRPVVILLSNGFRQARFQNVSMIERAPSPPEISDFGRPEQFVPQKTKAKRRPPFWPARAR